MRHTPALPRLRPKPPTSTPLPLPLLPSSLLLLSPLLLLQPRSTPGHMTMTGSHAHYTRSKIAAMPWPPPMHIVARP